MEQIFEKYIAKWVCRIFGERGWKVSIQDDGYYLFDEPQMFSLRPDIVLRRGDITVIMDTKWKRLDPNARNSGISQADMYQMYAYSKKYAQYDRPVPEVWLLYPYDEKSSQIEEKTFSSSDGVKVHIYFADVDETEKSISELMKEVDGKLSPI
jgi:5-methylcytosine-specific restriction enzyme subunit McrC